MSKEARRTLFIFRRDLRLEDNTGLNYALKNADEVLPCFIFTPEQIEKNPYRSNHCLQFMLESLEELAEALERRGGQLYFFYGKPAEVVQECLQHLAVDQVVFNRDYTPYSLERDAEIAHTCKKWGAKCTSFDDALIQPPETLLKGNGEPYTVFTPFFRHASSLDVPPPKPQVKGSYCHPSIAFAKKHSFLKEVLPERSSTLACKGGRSAAFKQLERLRKLDQFPLLEQTSHLSAYLKFTLLSPREVFHALSETLGSHHPLVRELYWRDFFTAIALFAPHVFKEAYFAKYNAIEWSDDRAAFGRWCAGETGFPIVDAGMRQLNQTGFIPNRIRMIVASFLIKDLHLSWQWGERYFAQTLIDYDPAVNNGNWQWVAGTGCSAQPYFRVFNPWIQQKKFDPDCAYIKAWVPELASLTSKEIHGWEAEKSRSLFSTYPEPMVEHAREAKRAIASYP